MKNVITVIKGMALGMAFVIPGFSGGTMAVILKIYNQLLNAISLNIEKLKKNIGFLLTLGVGLLLGIFGTSVILSSLFENFPVPTKLTLVGIVLGSLPMIWKEGTSERSFKPVNIIPFLLAFGVMVIMFFLENADAAQVAIETEFSMGLAVKLFFGGIVAALSMIIPGISGSLMLTIMGLYETAITAIKDLNIALIIPVGLGAVIGVLAGAKLISVLLSKFKQGTYAIIIGLIVGSLLTIFPSDFSFNTQGIVGIILGIVGIFIPVFFEKVLAPKTSEESPEQN
ncbi:MAG: DUF368 domain-containing protein [Oscillospiraceae bacterium]|nr:DUF368 domain-containing protein [Oscillospiraceae bacterium]